MILIQLDKSQLKILFNSAEKLRDVTFMEDALPPLHVFERAMDLCQRSVEAAWALPYFIKDGDQILGCCGFKDAPQNGQVEVGYNIALGARGKGVATSAVQQLSQIAFDSHQVNTVVALIASANQASLSVVRKNGFLYRESTIDDEGDALESWQLNRH